MKKYYAVSFRKTNYCCGSTVDSNGDFLKRLYEDKSEAVEKCMSLVKKTMGCFKKLYEEDEISKTNSEDNTYFFISSPDCEYEYKVNEFKLYK